MSNSPASLGSSSRLAGPASAPSRGPIDSGFAYVSDTHNRIHNLLDEVESKLLVSTTVANIAPSGDPLPAHSTELRNRLQHAGAEADGIVLRLSALLERI